MPVNIYVVTQPLTSDLAQRPLHASSLRISQHFHAHSTLLKPKTSPPEGVQFGGAFLVTHPWVFDHREGEGGKPSPPSYGPAGPT